jgi:hypothetical protein
MTTSILVKFRKSTVLGRFEILYFQFIHLRKVKVISTSFQLYPEEWDTQQASIQWGNAVQERHPYLQALEVGLKEELRQICQRIAQLDEKGLYTVDELAMQYVHHSFSGRLFPFIEHLIKGLHEQNRTKTASIYACVQCSFFQV